jgi:hypothetical protein
MRAVSKTMMISGPVSNASQGGKINPWFGIVIWWNGFSDDLDKIPERRVAAGRTSRNFVRHKRDLHSVYRHRAMCLGAHYALGKVRSRPIRQNLFLLELNALDF